MRAINAYALYALMHAPKRFLHIRALFAHAVYMPQSTFYTWERFLHTPCIHTKARLTIENAFCTRFLHASKRFLHIRALFAYTFYMH